MFVKIQTLTNFKVGRQRSNWKMAMVEYIKEGRIATIVLNRPEVLNAVNGAVLQKLWQSVDAFQDDDDLWVAIITGAGDKAFCVGADISDFGTAFAPEGEAFMARPDNVWKPFIAAVNGYCLGAGLELALMCDIRIASENAQFGQPEVKIGYMPAMGGTVRMPRFLPRALAAEMLLTGDSISAHYALHAGLVSRVVPQAKLLQTAKEIAQTVAARGPLAVRAVKESMVRGADLTQDSALELEKALAADLWNTEDFAEGARAFAEKRPPVFKGR